MVQYYLCIVLIVFVFFLLIHEVARDLKTLGDSYKRISLCLILVLLFKYNYGVHFYGLEYEDAFVFSLCKAIFI